MRNSFRSGEHHHRPEAGLTARAAEPNTHKFNRRSDAPTAVSYWSVTNYWRVSGPHWTRLVGQTLRPFTCWWARKLRRRWLQSFYTVQY